MNETPPMEHYQRHRGLEYRNTEPSMEQLTRPAAYMPRQQFWSERRPWGMWTVLHEGEGVKVKLIEIEPGHRLSLQYHRHRTEHWTCVGGLATAVIGEQTLELHVRQTALIPVRMTHRLGNKWRKPAFILEVQTGDILSEDDIVRLEDDYSRAGRSDTL